MKHNVRLFNYPTGNNSGQQLCSRSVPRYLSVPRSIKETRLCRRHGAAVIFVMVLATAVTWPIMQVLNDLNIAYLQTIVFILIIAALVQFVEMALKKFIPALHKSLGVYLPLITTNCAVLGVCISNIDQGYNFLQSLVNSFGAGVGFLLAMVIFSGMRTKLEGNHRYSGIVPGRSYHHDCSRALIPCIHGIRRISVV